MLNAWQFDKRHFEWQSINYCYLFYVKIGDKNMIYYMSNYNSIFGKIIIVVNDKALVGLWFERQKHAFKAIQGMSIKIYDENQIIRKIKKWLDNYFMGLRPSIKELPLELIGTKFQKTVWEILLSIPYGKTITYGEIAQIVAKYLGVKKMSSRAVGVAVGHNPISIIIPCHRVLGANGNLTGYAGGIDLKVKLLMHENVDTSNLNYPKRRV